MTTLLNSVLAEQDGPNNFDAPALPASLPVTGAPVPPVPQLPDTNTNWALHPLIVQQVDDHIYRLVSEARRQRQPLEEEWRSIDRMEALLHDSSRRYIGRHDSYLPIWARIKDTLVSQYLHALFPSDEYMDVSDRSSGDPERAKPVKAYVQWEFETNAKLRMQMESVLGQFVAQGNTVIKHWYKRDIVNRGSLQMGPNNVPQLQYGPVKKEGLCVKSRSIFNFYVWPTTASDMSEVTLCFEDVDVPVAQIDYLVKKGQILNGDRAMAAPEPDTHRMQQQEVHTNLYGIPAPQSSTLQGNYAAEVRTLTEVYTCMFLPREALLPGEDPECQYAVRLVLAGNAVIEARRNPYLDQQPPYEFHAARKRPAFAYGYGEGKMAMAIQSATNDSFNQWLDVGQYNLNPVVLANTSYLAGPLPDLYPGVVIPTLGNKEAFSFERPPFEMIQYGENIISYLRNLEEELSGAPPQQQGTGSAGAKTATQAQILQRNNAVPLQSKTESLEQALLVPTMTAAWTLGQQYRSADVMLTVAGAPYRISPAMLIIDAEMRWLASSQALNQAQRTQALGALLTLAMNPVVIQLIMQRGKIVDPSVILKRMYSDQGFRGFDSFIRDMTPQDVASMMQMQANANAGANAQPGQQKPGDRPRSSVEQAGAGDHGQQAAPGEAADFMEVRQGADQMAAQQGGSNGRFT